MTDIARLVLDADTKGLKDAERDLDSLQATAVDTVRGIGQSMQRIGVGLSASITAPVALFAKGASQAAIDAQEMESAFDVVFGNMSDDVRQWAEETGDALGRSTQEIQRGALAFQELFGKALDPSQAAEMSKQFAVLTQDLASFKNLSNEVAQQKLFSGLTGEAEPLRAVGVFINDAAVKAKALELGLSGVNGKLTDQEKIVARSALIQEQLADAQGDVARTSESTANQIKTAQAAFEELQVTIGEKLLPIITPLIAGFASFLDFFANLPGPVQNTILVIVGLAAALGPLLLVFGSIAALAPTLSVAFLGIGSALLPLAPIIAGVAAAGYLIYENWDKISPVVDEVGERFREVLGPKVQALVDTVSAKFKELWEGPLGEGVRMAMDMFWQFQAAYGSVFGEVLVRVLDGAVTLFGGAINAILDFLTMVSRFLQGDFSGAWEAFVQLVTGIRETVFGVINALVPELVAMGRNIIEGLIAGIKAAPEAVFNALKGVIFSGIDRVKDLLGINSPSLLFMEMGGFMMEGLVIGIEQQKQDVLDTLGDLGTGISQELESMADSAGTHTARISDSFETMTNSVLGSVRSLANGIKDGDFFSILDSALGLFDQLGGFSLFGGGAASNRSMGGPVYTGKPYIVGENGPELFTPPGTGQIVANDNMSQNVHVTVGVDPRNGNVLAFVDGRIAASAPLIANAGASKAVTAQSRAGYRSL